MRFVLFIVDDPDHTEADEAAAPSIDDWFADVRTQQAFVQGVRLQPVGEARTVRVRGGETLVTEEPFTISAETILGFGIIECDTIEQAIDIAACNPTAYRGRIEVREIHSMGEPELR